MSRKTVIFFLLVLTVSLTSLGLRLPGLNGMISGSGKPKPRPRAVIHKQVTPCKKIFKALADTAAILPGNAAAIEFPLVPKPRPLFAAQARSFERLLPGTSRAPPTDSLPV